MRKSGVAPRWRLTVWLCIVVLAVSVAGCTAFLPASAPTRAELVQKQTVREAGIQIIAVDDLVVKSVTEREKGLSLASLDTGCLENDSRVGPGDVLGITIWESPPAALFGSITTLSNGTIQNTSAPVTLPEQQISREGSISVPFAGTFRAASLTTKQIETQIASRLKGKANAPQVMVRVVKNVSSSVTVVGEVANTVMPLTPKCERLLDVLATAGLKQQTNKLMVQLTRGDTVRAVPMDNLILDGRENIHAVPGDIVTVLYQPLSFTALGASGKNAEIEFEAKGITLAQALSRMGGLADARADTQGVFIFRYEPVGAMTWPESPLVTSDGKVPVIYTVNLRDARTFFAAKSFPIKDKDLVFVANAPGAQLQKFMTLVGSVVNPALNSAIRVDTLSHE
jgi:polysaccharide biosynthesis/export protein